RPLHRLLSPDADDHIKPVAFLRLHLEFVALALPQRIALRIIGDFLLERNHIIRGFRRLSQDAGQDSEKWPGEEWIAKRVLDLDRVDLPWLDGKGFLDPQL